MVEPVFASDGFSYENTAIQNWFDTGHFTSPKTNENLTSLTLTPNLGLRTVIREWMDRQHRGKADREQMKLLKAELFNITTSKEALDLVRNMSELVTSSKFCLLAPSGVDSLQGLLDYKKILNDEVASMLLVLTSQCQTEIHSKQKKRKFLWATATQKYQSHYIRYNSSFENFRKLTHVHSSFLVV